MEEDTAEPVGQLEALDALMRYAEADGDISEFLDDTQLATLGQEVCDQYDRDKESRSDWEKVAEKALKDLSGAHEGTKDFPWPNASNVHYPLLQQAVQQFWARAYPSVVKGDEAVSIKVVGKDEGVPVMGPQGPMMQVQGMPVMPTPQGPAVMTPQGPMPLPEGAQPEPMWQREPGAKAKRAQRVASYMNFLLFYRMANWEGETSTLLYQMPAIGPGFRKIWFDGQSHNSRFVPAMKLVVDNDSKSLADAPQIAEEIDGVFPHQIKRDMRSGRYREMPLDPEERESRLLIEAQCYYDLDGDGLDEPYIVTVDHKTKFLLRVVPDFGPEQVKLAGNRIAFIERRTFYVKYEFLPHPEGKFYNPGLAHILAQHGEVINTLLNQAIDTNTAIAAGGGFIGSGLRIQGQGQSSSLKFRPGEYKTVPVSGNDLRNGIYERTTPQLSPVMFNLLEMILGAAEGLASIKDVLSGDASNNGQVGTTLALIEQGLQVFNAIYKMVFLGLKGEFKVLFDNIAAHADERMAAEYMELLDDPAADFAADFNVADMDIRPISDASSVTKMQRHARAQFLLSTLEPLSAVGGDGREVMRRVYEAVDIEDIDKLLPAPQPNPLQEAAGAAEIEATKAKAAKDMADAQAKGAKVQFDFAKLQQDGAVDQAKLAVETVKTEIAAFEAGANVGAA